MGALDASLLATIRLASRGRSLPGNSTRTAGFIVGPSVINVTSGPRTLETYECFGTVITNTGASGAITFNLPPALPGMCVTWVLTQSAAVVINPQDTEQILGASNAAGDSITVNGAAKNCIRLFCGTAGSWLMIDVSNPSQITDTN